MRTNDAESEPKTVSADEHRSADTDELEADLERLIQPGGASELSSTRVFAVIPESVFESSPAEFAEFLQSVFDAEAGDDELVDAALEPGSQPKGRQPLHALVPSEALSWRFVDLEHLLSEVAADFDEIDELLSAFHRGEGCAPELSERLRAALEEHETALGPEDVVSAIDRAPDDATRFQLLFRQARHSLRNLKVYRLSRHSPGTLVSRLRLEENLTTVRYLVEFLRAIHHAAESFERIEIPRAHIRDYLEYLYQMEDWQEMERLVRRLEKAVRRFLANQRQEPEGP